MKENNNCSKKIHSGLKAYKMTLLKEYGAKQAIYSPQIDKTHPSPLKHLAHGERDLHFCIMTLATYLKSALNKEILKLIYTPTHNPYIPKSQTGDTLHTQMAALLPQQTEPYNKQVHLFLFPKASTPLILSPAQ